MMDHIRRALFNKVKYALNGLDQFHGGFRPSDPLQPKPIILRIQDPTGDVRSLYAIIHEWIGEHLGEELGMVWRAVENEVADSSEFVSIEEVGRFHEWHES